MINTRTSCTTHPSNHLQKLHHMTHELLNSKTVTTVLQHYGYRSSWWPIYFILQM